MKTFAIATMVAASLAGAGAPAFAHDATLTAEIGSTADGGGALVSSLNFNEQVARLSYSTTVGPNSIYTGELPAFESLSADAAPNLYVLDPGTQVSVQITAIDAGASVTINSTTLDSPGDSVVLGSEPIGHNHPAWLLSLALPHGSFGEATITFKLTTTSGLYTESQAYRLQLNNGVLPPPSYDTAAYDKGGVACRQAVGKAAQKFFDKKVSLLRKCLDKVEVKEAKESLTIPPADVAAADAAAEAICVGEAGTPSEKTMLGKIDAARAKALEAIQGKCGSASPLLSDDDVTQHLGLISCRAEELIGAIYGNAKGAISEYSAQASQGGASLDTYLPCLKHALAE